MARKKTFQDVARLAEVSPSTVSRVSSGIVRVDGGVADRVRDAAAKLGVDLNPRKKARIVGFVLSNREMLHPFHSRILAGAEAYCSPRGYSLLFLPYRYLFNTSWRQLHMPEIWTRREIICGFIVAGANAQNLFELLHHHDIPFAAFGNNVAGDWRQDECDAVWFDDVEGAFEMTRHLLSLGHREIWFLANCQLPWFSRRYQGYLRAMNEAGLAPHIRDVDSESIAEVGYLATKSLLSQRERVTAIFAGDDYVATGAYRALNEAGLRIPEDISVVGFSDTGADTLSPPLTTAREFPEQVGKHLAQQLLQRIGSPDLEPQHYTIPTQLVQRASSQRLFEGSRSARDLVKDSRVSEVR